MSGSAASRRPRPWGNPGVALIAASVLLPLILFALAAWYSYGETLRKADARVERTALVLEEHALKVFETHRLVIEEVNLRLRFMDWSKEAERADLHKMLARLQDDLDQVSTVTVMDAQGRMIASGRAYPANPAMSFADRDYFKLLARDAPALPIVSRSYTGRQTGQVIFNLAGRLNPGPNGAFAGVVAVSADRGYFEHFYGTLDPGIDHRVLLVRADGAILASEPPLPFADLPPDSTLRARMHDESGTYTTVSKLDGVERIFAFRKIGPYPVFVRYGISTTAALASWRSNLAIYGVVAVLVALALLLVSTLAVRQTQRERVARRRWQETAAALQAEAAERERVAGQLRQAQKMEAVGRLTGGLAHDFNNLLTAVIGSLDLVRRRPGALDERNLRFIANALEGAQRAATLTSRLLAFSRQQALEPATVDVNARVAGMLELLGSTLGERVELVTALASDAWPVTVDPNGLESVVVNLAVNARDAMPEGGRITIETGNATIGAEEFEAAPGDYLRLVVADTGTGMAPEVVAQIFEPFFTTKPVGKGTGLGLSQVYGFVKQSGGHISVASAPGEGTTFKILMPRAAAVAGAAPVIEEPEASPPPWAARGETILVVEDEAMVRSLSVAALEDAGYVVLAAADAEAALAILRAHAAIALLFTDIVLPGAMNGRALADVVARERPALPVLFTTGYSRNAIVHDGRLDEGVELLAKPFTSAALVARVQGLLSPRDSSRSREKVARRSRVG